ncbi:uncharacterized protein LAJ45_10422 [Morchella importuna]|uniref:uncharacterized protein n=1 Tax=Morchella importuna TaxID=1174673 RepID=UPI001E8E6842|nr:uncharacterized protein LAJ45_10422 [Morchella importuna]KAH8145621.1 hypothetical protein LAJ45_10422 [Morchella importuna]
MNRTYGITPIHDTRNIVTLPPSVSPLSCVVTSNYMWVLFSSGVHTTVPTAALLTEIEIESLYGGRTGSRTDGSWLGTCECPN